jgi:hypothetical protein
MVVFKDSDLCIGVAPPERKMVPTSEGVSHARLPLDLPVLCRPCAARAARADDDALKQGQAAFENKDHDAAIKSLSEAIKDDPTNALAFAAAGRCCLGPHAVQRPVMYRRPVRAE